MVFFSRKIEDHVSHLFAKISSHDITATCVHLRKNGYPFRIGILCDKFQLDWPLRGVSLSTGHLTVNAPVYASHWIEFNVHSPASIVFMGKSPIVSHWRKLVIETEPYWKRDQKLKLRAEGLEISFLEKKNHQRKLKTQATDTKMRQENAENEVSLKDTYGIITHSLDQNNVLPKIAAEFLKLDLKREKNQLSGYMIFDDFDVSYLFSPYFSDFPKVDGNLQWTFDDMDNLFDAHNERNWKQHLYGKSGFLKHSELTFQTGGVLHVSGPFSFDDEGYLTAKFQISFLQKTKLLTTLQHLFPAQERTLETLFFILNSFPQNADGSSVFSLLINHGWVKLGFVKLGRLAPL
ncbi:DUF2125 domain-containing protein [Bartonella raoultii]|uniref:DUF2125 domain-containing protein n=1 Tax=Bartonella raoultii TaxID=1457020 RepID=A0ABS7I8M0_9HYPH|nr:DUF2125 domain-containing protein [Bartonella raoultii]